MENKKYITSDVIYNPAVPFWGRIPNGLHPGKMIEINGHVPHGAQRFVVNLVAGDHEESNIPLHISVRFDQRCIVRNSLINKKYGSEERDGNLSISTGKDFKLVILTEEKGYKIAVNNYHFCNYDHRLDHKGVTNLNIQGNVRIKTITHDENGLSTHPSTWASDSAESPLTLYNVSIPLLQSIPNGLKPGSVIFITGYPYSNPYRFVIDLQCGIKTYPIPDVAFHLSVRFDQNSVVRNTKIAGIYGSEETYIDCFPFECGVYFDMVIQVQSEKFAMAVNGKQFIEYRHRILPLKNVNALKIDGDVRVSCIRFEEC